MLSSVVYICVVATCLVYPVRSASLRFAAEGHCKDIPDVVLTEILGPAFNSRYMSIEVPREEEEASGGPKRGAPPGPSFYVDDDYTRELGHEEPAWTVNHVLLSSDAHAGGTRRKRASRQWECESVITWIDLGPDYFPRYLRSVECTSKHCWYGHYKCKPRSFTVKLLRRKRGRCTTKNTKVGVDGLPIEFRQLWVWEERAVNFCCDCAL